MNQEDLKQLSREELEEMATKLLIFASDFRALVGVSGGVIGLHLSGNVASWEELLLGGNCEGWLASFNDVEGHL